MNPKTIKTKSLFLILALSLALQPFLIKNGWAKTAPIVDTIDNSIQVQVYKVKKKSDFVAVEIGFTNTTDNYLAFTPKEIYLNGSNSYSVAPIPFDQLNDIEATQKNYSLIPLSLAIGLGIGAIGASNHQNVARGLAMAALGMGGVFALSEILQNKADKNTLITFENNSLSHIDKLPPGVTLGGFLYFPKVKSPQSLTIIKKVKGIYSKDIIHISKK